MSLSPHEGIPRKLAGLAFTGFTTAAAVTAVLAVTISAWATGAPAGFDKNRIEKNTTADEVNLISAFALRLVTERLSRCINPFTP
jgi:hypothetical protein